MTGIGPFDHPILTGLTGDAQMAQIWSADQSIAQMRAFEAAFSRAMGAAGLFDPAQARAAATSIEQAVIDRDDLRQGCASDGLAVPRLVRQLRAQAGNAAVHHGATSQDVIDTSLAMTLRNTTRVIMQRLETACDSIAELERRFGSAPLMGRTRMRAALVITVADRLRTWRMPMDDYATSLSRMRPMIERIQLGGPVGDRSAFAEQAPAIAAQMADELDLHPADSCWHTMRHDVVAYASQLSLITGTLGKMGQDIVLMAQQGIDEIDLEGGGGSSAMPHKQNPVTAELLVTLARFNAVQIGGMHQAMVHEQERSGVAWALEWMILPQMALATGRALTAATEICKNIKRIGGPA